MTEYTPEKVADLIAWAEDLGDFDSMLSVPGYAKVAFRAIADALEAVARERDEFRKATTEALAIAESNGVMWGDELRINAESLLGVLRAALDKEGNDDGRM